MHKKLTTVTLTAFTTGTLLFGTNHQLFAVAETAPTTDEVSTDESTQLIDSATNKTTLKDTVASNDDETKTQQIIVNGQIKTVEITDDADLDEQLDAVLEEEDQKQDDATKPKDQIEKNSNQQSNSTSSSTSNSSKGSGNAETNNGVTTNDSNTPNKPNKRPSNTPKESYEQNSTDSVKNRAKGFARAKSGQKTYIEKNGNQIRVWSANSKEQVYTQLSQQGIDVGQLSNGKYYIVQWGDTLSAISEATNIEVHKIASDNAIQNIDLIFEGQSLFLRK